MKLYKTFIFIGLQLICLIRLQAQDEQEEKCALLREIKKFIGNYEQAINRLGSSTTSFAVMPNLVDSISSAFFVSPATKVFNDLETNAEGLLPVYIQDYLENVALNSRKSIVTSLDICNLAISQVKQSVNQNFNYVEVVLKKQVFGRNFQDEEIKFDKKMVFLLALRVI